MECNLLRNLLEYFTPVALTVYVLLFCGHHVTLLCDIICYVTPLCNIIYHMTVTM